LSFSLDYNAANSNVTHVGSVMKKNDAAVDLWRQIFARMARAEDAAMVDPDHNDKQDEDRFREGMLQAGWSDEEVSARLELHKHQIGNAPVTSPGVNPHVEMLYGRLCDDVEAAMTRLHLESHVHVARGVEPRVGPAAAMTNVIMTDESIVVVSAFLFRFCGLVARAFARTIHLWPDYWDSNRFYVKDALAYLRDSADLHRYWVRIFISYAVTGTPILVPFRPANRYELILFEQIARAMEVFAIAHEYGHHHLKHGRAPDVDPKQEELEADQFALRVSYEVENSPILLENPYMSSGAGGIILLFALETLRVVKSVILGASIATSDTHPTVEERIARLNTVAVIKPAEFIALQRFRVAASRIMKLVEDEVVNMTRGAPPSVRARLRAMAAAI
jgi:hypothetical protein